MPLVKLDLLTTKVKEMNATDNFVDGQTVSRRITRSRYHYKPISSAELLLTIALSTFVGLGLFVATAINVEESANSQMQLSTVEQYSNSANTNLFLV